MADAAVQAKARRLPAALLAALRMMSERSAVGLCTIATTGPIGDGEISLTTARALVRRRMAAAEGSAYSATPAGEAYLRDLTWRRNGQ